MSRPRILVLPFPLLSHYLRCLTLLRSLRGQYEIVFAGSCGAADYPAREGFATVPVEQFPVDQMLQDTRGFSFGWLSEDNIARVLRGYVRAIEAEKPQLVVSDSAQVARMAAELTRVPHLALLNGYLARTYALVRGIPENHPAKRFESQTPPGLFEAILRGAEAAAMKRVHAPFRSLRRVLQLPPTEHYLDEFRGNVSCLCDPETIFPQKHRSKGTTFLADYQVIGPVYYDEPGGERDPCERRTDSRPLLFVTMGSSGDWSAARLLLGPEFHDFDIVLSGKSLGIVSQRNIQVYDFIPPSEILPRASAVLCHGGNGTIYQALSYGVPVLCRPSQFEQEWNVQRFETLNLITRISSAVTAEELKTIVAHTIHGRSALLRSLSAYDLTLPPTLQRFHAMVARALG